MCKCMNKVLILPFLIMIRMVIDRIHTQEELSFIKENKLPKSIGQHHKHSLSTNDSNIEDKNPTSSKVS